jgi:hypothetical protein
MNLEIIISKLRFWLTTRLDCYVVDVISTWFILHQLIRKVIFCEIIELIKFVTNSSFKNIRMSTLKSHCRRYFINLFSQIFLTDVFAKIKEIFDMIFTIEIQRERFSETIDERNARNQYVFSFDETFWIYTFYQHVLIKHTHFETNFVEK